MRLSDELRRRYGSDSDQPILTLVSFAFSRGISRTADLVFDLRFLPNPHWVDELRPLTGADQPVRDYLAADPSWSETMDRIELLLTDWIPRYWAADKSYVTVAFGCTGGGTARSPRQSKLRNGCVAQGFLRMSATVTSPRRPATRPRHQTTARSARAGAS